MAQAYREVYTKYMEKLVRCLPMNDVLFIAKLSTEHLLPGDTQDHIQALPTSANKSSYFLSQVIKPSLDIDSTGTFDTLLSVMEACEYAHVKALAAQIKDAIASTWNCHRYTVHNYVHKIMYTQVFLKEALFWDQLCTYVF